MSRIWVCVGYTKDGEPIYELSDLTWEKAKEIFHELAKVSRERDAKRRAAETRIADSGDDSA